MDKLSVNFSIGVSSIDMWFIAASLQDGTAYVTS